MCVEITEIGIEEKLQLEKFLALFGIEARTREGMGGYDILFTLADNIKLVVGSDNITLVDYEALNFITICRSNFLQVKIQ